MAITESTAVLNNLGSSAAVWCFDRAPAMRRKNTARGVPGHKKTTTQPREGAKEDAGKSARATQSKPGADPAARS